MNDNEVLAKVRRVSDVLLETLETAAKTATTDTFNEISGMAYALKEYLELEAALLLVEDRDTRPAPALPDVEAFRLGPSLLDQLRANAPSARK